MSSKQTAPAAPLWRIALPHVILAPLAFVARVASEPDLFGSVSAWATLWWLVLAGAVAWAWTDTARQTGKELRPLPKLPRLPRISLGPLADLWHAVRAIPDPRWRVGCMAVLILPPLLLCTRSIGATARLLAALWENPLAFTLACAGVELALLTAALARAGALGGTPRTLADRIRAATKARDDAVREVEKMRPPEDDDSEEAERLNEICDSLVAKLDERLETTLNRLMEDDDDAGDYPRYEDEEAAEEDEDEGDAGPFPAR
jgi:hypothetical protein